MSEFETVIPYSAQWPNTVPCECGKGAYYWDDGDGWVPKGRVIDGNSDGRTVGYCPDCDRELVAGARRDQSEQDNREGEVS